MRKTVLAARNGDPMIIRYAIDARGLAAGFADRSVTFTHEAAPGMHSAIIRAVKTAA